MLIVNDVFVDGFNLKGKCPMKNQKCPIVIRQQILLHFSLEICNYLGGGFICKIF